MVQTVTATSTVDLGSFTITGAATGHEAIDEGIGAADGNTTRVTTTASDTCSFHLGDPSDPLIHTGHKLIYNCRQRNPGTALLTTSLLQGATPIASQQITPSDTAYGTHTLTLSEAEAANITDYTDLRVEFDVDITGGIDVRVTAVDFEVPDITLTPSPVTATLSSVAAVVTHLLTLTPSPVTVTTGAPAAALTHLLTLTPSPVTVEVSAAGASESGPGPPSVSVGDLAEARAETAVGGAEASAVVHGQSRTSLGGRNRVVRWH